MADSDSNPQYVNERWRPVFDWVGLYKVSDYGRVQSVFRTVSRRDGTIQVFQALLRKLSVSSKGYLCVRLSDVRRRKTARVHRLVALAFLGLPPEGKPEVNHIDGNKQNNRLDNLEWVSSHGNRKHAWDTGLRTRAHLPIQVGAEQRSAKLTDAIVLEVRRLSLNGVSTRSLARAHGVDAKTMRHAICGKAWKHVPLPAPPTSSEADRP